MDASTSQLVCHHKCDRRNVKMCQHGSNDLFIHVTGGQIYASTARAWPSCGNLHEQGLGIYLE